MKMKNEIIKICRSKGFLLDKEILEYFENLEIENIKKIVDIFFGIGIKEKILNREIFDKNIGKFRNLITNKNIKSEKSDNNIKVLTNSENFSKKIELNDFISHFKSRFNIIKTIFEKNYNESLVSIRKIGAIQNNYNIIGAVLEKRITKNKNLLIEIEDLTGRIVILVNKENQKLFSVAKELLLDDIVLFRASGTNEILFVNDIIFPDAALDFEKFGKKDEYAAFSGDFHIGSRYFLENNLLKFVNWLNGEVGDERQRMIASKIKYLFLLGDNIDGIGVYQDQYQDLVLKNITSQYSKLENILIKIRKDITIIMCPGQHDAVWIGEKQHKIPKKWAPGLYNMENMHLVSNPSYIQIGDFKILMYHGASINRFIDEIPSLRIKYGHSAPTKITKEMLRRRHLAPTYGIMDFIPNKEKDFMTIDEIPDIFVTGDQHRCEIDNYNNILLISTSCWQNQTRFEKKMGNTPDHCKVPLFNFKTREIKIMDFGEDDKIKEDDKK